MFRSESSWQDASGLEQREGASRGVEGGGNERPLVAGMDAQRNPAWDARSVAQVQSCVAFRKKTLSPSPAWDFHRLFEFLGICVVPCDRVSYQQTARTVPRLIYLYTPRRSFV